MAAGAGGAAGLIHCCLGYTPWDPSRPRSPTAHGLPVGAAAGGARLADPPRRPGSVPNRRPGVRDAAAKTAVRFGSPHPGVFSFAMGDGSVRGIHYDADKSLL
ncbi:H-X9-DG-CTERM domain-containing protein [Posidoniimonas polymericola]|uniref:H-X9-DG-CTERM domain-containing protein n=1 Tax=Posidoniimonas polymericola TaxID=2528002 RepID=UPI0011B364F1|nr:H-X9-DG-CTERM domain-containing protein [Posidoniimonas polymericola]